MTRTPVSLREVVAFRLRLVRAQSLAAPLTQDDVARAAQRLGFEWGRSSVAAIEAAERDLSASELLALPYIVDEAVRVARPDARVAVGTSLSYFLVPEDGQSLLVVDGLTLSNKQVDQWLDGRPPRIAPRKLDEERPQVGEAERKAARALGVDVEVILETSVDLWGRTLTDQRDDLLRGEQPSAQRRGHITRGLLSELREALAKKGAK